MEVESVESTFENVLTESVFDPPCPYKTWIELGTNDVSVQRTFSSSNFFDPNTSVVPHSNACAASTRLQYHGPDTKMTHAQAEYDSEEIHLQKNIVRPRDIPAIPTGQIDVQWRRRGTAQNNDSGYGSSTKEENGAGKITIELIKSDQKEVSCMGKVPKYTTYLQIWLSLHRQARSIFGGDCEVYRHGRLLSSELFHEAITSDQCLDLHPKRPGN